MASREQSGYPSPLSFVAQLQPGVDHPLKEIPAEVIGKLNGVLFPPAGVVVSALDHFTLYQGPLVAATLNGYTVVGAGTPIVKIIPTSEYGVVGLDTSAVAADNTVLRQENMTVRYATDKVIVYAARLNLQQVATTALLAGVYVTTDTVLTLPTDGLFFSKVAAATELTFNVRASGTSSAQVLPLTLVDGEDIVVAFRVEQGGITPYVKTASAASWTVGVGVPSTDANVPSTAADLLQHVGIETAGGVVNAELDWQHVSKDA